MVEPQIMEESTGNSKNAPKKSASLGRIMGFLQYKVRPRYEPKSLEPACTKLSNFVPILDTSIVTTPTYLYHLWVELPKTNTVTQEGTT